jgi:hypothetical protein
MTPPLDDTTRTTWRLFLQQPDLVERIALLPVELQRSLGGLLEAACDMAQEAYAIPYGGQDLGEKVQTSGEGGSVRKTTNAHFARHLRNRLPHRIDGLRTEIRKLLCFDEAPRSGPRFRRTS